MSNLIFSIPECSASGALERRITVIEFLHSLSESDDDLPNLEVCPPEFHLPIRAEFPLVENVERIATICDRK
jgi:hypothetical protein